MLPGGEGQRDRLRDVSVQQLLLTNPVLHEGGSLLHILRLMPALLAGGRTLHQILQRWKILFV